MKHLKKLAFACFAAMPLMTSSICCAAQRGDVDLDGKITAADATFALQYTLTGPKTGLTAEQIKAADFDENGAVTAEDASYILQKALRSDFDIKKEPDTSDGVVVSNFEEFKKAVNDKEKKIYIKGTIECSERFILKDENAGVEFYGLTNADGTGAVLDFAKQRDSCTGSGESSTAIIIQGTGYDFTNIIFQNSGDCGLRIKNKTTEAAGNCVFTNCVFRYNNNSGVAMTNGTHDCIFINCDSYRNGDIVQKSGADADGFSVKIGAGGGNAFYNCRAWENADDGWDSYDRMRDGGRYVSDVTYVESLAWHNGNTNIFTGEYDYINGYPLDKNLLYVQAILASDPDFETKYNNREFEVDESVGKVKNWPNVTLSLLGASNNYSKLYSSWGGNPNGFKFGSSESDSTGYRYIANCIAFDHSGNKDIPVQYQAKGFDQNCDRGSGGIHFDLKNILSFGNVENIQMVKMNADSISGVVWSFDSIADPTGTVYPDEPSGGMTVTEPENKDELREKVYAYRDMIYGYVYNDKIPGEQHCDVFGETVSVEEFLSVLKK